MCLETMGEAMRKWLILSILLSSNKRPVVKGMAVLFEWKYEDSGGGRSISKASPYSQWGEIKSREKLKPNENMAWMGSIPWVLK